MNLTRRMLHTTSNYVSATSSILRRQSLTILADSRHLPIPLIGVRQIRIIWILINASNIRINMSTMTDESTVLHWDRTLPLHWKISRLHATITRALSKRYRYSLRAIRIIISTHTERCGRQYHSATWPWLHKRVLLRRLFRLLSTALHLKDVGRESMVI